MIINKNEQNDLIQQLLICPQKQITRQLFNKINNKKQKKISLSERLKQSSNFITKFLHNHQGIRDLITIAIEFDKSMIKTASLKLLKNGEYLQKLQQKDLYLMFSQYGVTCVRKLKTQDSFYGFKYKFEKYAYIGQFVITNNKFVFQGKQGQLREIVSQADEKKYIFNVGDWMKGSIRKGKREIYKDQNNKKILIQNYSGEFIDMKYDGLGTLETISMNKNIVLKGQFQCGQLIKRVDFD